MKKIYTMLLLSIAVLTNLQLTQDIFDNDPTAIEFQPADEFKAPSMVGLFFKQKATATIRDPEQETITVIFVFEKVIEKKGNIPQDPNLSYIGSYKNKKNKTRHLYGILRDPLWK